MPVLRAVQIGRLVADVVKANQRVSRDTGGSSRYYRTLGGLLHHVRGDTDVQGVAQPRSLRLEDDIVRTGPIMRLRKSFVSIHEKSRLAELELNSRNILAIGQ